MPIYPTSPPPPPTLRDIRRDRSILALAAALCGALSAAGLAALAVVTQLSTNQGESAMSDATAALTAATEQLESTQAELLAEKRVLASAKEELMATRQELRRSRSRSGPPHHRCAKRKGKGKRRGERPPSARGPGVVTTHYQAKVNFAAPLTTITHAGLTCSDEHRCQIHREFVDAALSDPHSLAHIIPSIRDGKRLGVKIYGLQGSGTLKLLGFRNGDLIKAVNGHSLTGSMSPNLSFIRRGYPKTVSVDLERKGEKVTKHFEIL